MSEINEQKEIGKKDIDNLGKVKNFFEKSFPHSPEESEKQDNDGELRFSKGKWHKSNNGELREVKIEEEIKEVAFRREALYFTPEKNGKWDGERGNSKWIPDKEYKPPEKNPEKRYSNPDDLKWEKIFDKYGIDGIEFKDNFPVFNDISKGTVEIENFETGKTKAKNHNFNEADKKLAEQKGCTPKEVEQWRRESNYTWHECEDKSTMQKVPNEIHANIAHSGGRSQRWE